MRLPKKIIDSNVILRFFLADDEKQFPRASEFIQALEAGSDEALLTEMVFAEVVWGKLGDVH
jgi:predicted nucleic acid-binding protein